MIPLLWIQKRRWDLCYIFFYHYFGYSFITSHMQNIVSCIDKQMHTDCLHESVELRMEWRCEGEKSASHLQLGDGIYPFSGLKNNLTSLLQNCMLLGQLTQISFLYCLSLSYDSPFVCFFCKILNKQLLE